MAFITFGNASSAPARDIVPVSPSDSADLPGGVCRALRCLTPGTVTGVTAAGVLRVTEVFTAGEYLLCGWIRIHDTGTDAALEAFY